MKQHILIIDDDERLQSLLAEYIRNNGFYTSSAKNTVEAREALDELAFDCIVLDVMMPGESGIDALPDLQKHAPVLMLTALGEPEDRIKGLENGAMDYLVKPFEPKELLLRIRNLIGREISKTGNALINNGLLEIDTDLAIIKSHGGDMLELTQNESRFLVILDQNDGRAVSRERIAKELMIGERAVDVMVTRLRRKLSQIKEAESLIATVRGSGYKIRRYTT